MIQLHHEPTLCHISLFPAPSSLPLPIPTLHLPPLPPLSTSLPQLLSSLRVLLTLPPPTTPHMKEIHKQVSNGVTELIHSHAGAIKTPHDWSIFFTILEYTGTGLSQYTPQGHVTIETVTMETASHEMGVATTAAEEIDFEARDEEQTDSSTHQLASDWPGVPCCRAWLVCAVM